MKRYFAFTAVVLFSMLFLTNGCDKFRTSDSGKEMKQSVEMETEEGEKGKFEMSEEVPPAPGEEELAQKQEQQESVQKQTKKQQEPIQKQTQKQAL